MASNDKWITRALVKLKQQLLEGNDFDERIWDFDWDINLSLGKNLDNVYDEDAALETLTKARVIESISQPNRHNIQAKDLLLNGGKAIQYEDWDVTNPARREYEWTRIIKGFDYDNFIKFSEQFGIDIANNGTYASLEILSGVTPVIHIKEQRFTLSALAAGSTPQQIIEYAAKQFDTLITLDELRSSIKNVQLQDKRANLKQLLRKNIFGEDGTLQNFAVITSKTILLKREALLTASQVEKLSTN
ncbi:hypothetical protein EON76_00215 [bacterium]|nr:MAG: hypothetical protein EON76_00215 [bacterium]